jgi:hypothetical protein
MDQFMNNQGLRIPAVFALVAAVILGFVMASAHLDIIVGLIISGLFLMGFLPSYLLLYFQQRKRPEK